MTVPVWVLLAFAGWTLLHIGTKPGEFTAGPRFAFFLVQLACMVATGGIVIARAL
ncbi:hypothetical protein [Lentisalinibacter sediminis]|uniref:hypothetical protein n=1 Tax=Lentisalinibacter sediminis TaxID=2992237 RepID=UPI00386C608B